MYTSSHDADPATLSKHSATICFYVQYSGAGFVLGRYFMSRAVLLCLLIADKKLIFRKWLPATLLSHCFPTVMSSDSTATSSVESSGQAEEDITKQEFIQS